MCLGSENPKKRAMYMETNQIAEKWSKIAFVSFVVLLPVCGAFPKAIIVYLNYFKTDLGSDAFELPFVMW